MKLLIAAIAIASSGAAAGAQDTVRTTRAPVYSAAQAERGKMTYASTCRSCHTGASHTGVAFAKWWKGRTLGDLFGYVSNQMPKNDPGSLDAEQVADVMAYLLKMNLMPAGTAELLPDSSALAQIRIEIPLPKTKAVVKKPSPTRTKRP